MHHSPRPSEHNTPLPLERSSPASFKRLLGSDERHTSTYDAPSSDHNPMRHAWPHNENRAGGGSADRRPSRRRRSRWRLPSTPTATYTGVVAMAKAARPAENRGARSEEHTSE